MLFKKILRTFRVYLAQSISMILMITIGVGIFVGFNMEWKTIEYNVDNFFSDCNAADYTIYSDYGFDKTKAEMIEKVEGIDIVSRQLSIDTTYDDATLTLNVVDNYKLNTFYLIDGLDYDNSLEGIWLSDSFAQKKNIKVNDNIDISFKGISLNVKVIGLIKQADYLVCMPQGGSQLLPDFNKYAFFYTNPYTIRSFNVLNYSKLLVKSSLSKEEVTNKVSEALDSNLLVLDLSQNTSYALADGEKEEGITMSSILPWFFLFIGILSMVTTMDRIARSEKVQIGTLKALGFKNRSIILHYLLFPLLIAALGSILGIILGYGVCYYIMNPNGSMGVYFDMPSWNMKMPWFCILVVLLMDIVLILTGYLSVKRMLKGSASDALKKYIPSKTKALRIEKFKIWNKLSFTSRWNLRDTFHHKARSFMTLFGIVGSMILLFASFAMRDSVKKYIDNYENKILMYETKINLDNSDNIDYDAFNTLARDIAKEYSGDTLSSNSVKYKNETISLNIYNIKNDTYHFINRNNDEIALPSDGALVCWRLKNENNLKIGDTIKVSFYGSNDELELKVSGFSMSSGEKSIEVSEEYINQIYSKYSINSIFTKELSKNIKDNEIISSKMTKDDVMKSYDTLLDLMDTMLILLIAAAVILGVVVLYNLGLMSYVERYKEFATLKVVGFKNKDISKMMVKQNVWMTIIGIVIGIPLGYLVLKLCLDALASEYEMKIYTGWLTYVMSIVFTFIFSFVVSLIVQRKNRKISMTEALKGNE